MQQKTEVATTRTTTQYEFSATNNEWVPVHKDVTVENETVVRSD